MVAGTVPFGQPLTGTAQVKSFFYGAYMTAKFSAKRRAAVFDMFGGRCAYCGAAIESKKVMHIDHVRPRAKGGGSSIGNLFPACATCNVAKGARDLESLRVNLALRRSKIHGIIGAAQAINLMEAGVDLPIEVQAFYFEVAGNKA